MEPVCTLSTVVVWLYVPLTDCHLQIVSTALPPSLLSMSSMANALLTLCCHTLMEYPFKQVVMTTGDMVASTEVAVVVSTLAASDEVLA